jgi:hypothetical protein
VSACKSCGAEIIFAFTRDNKRMPVDAAPNPQGNITLWEVGGVTRATVLAGSRLELARAEQQELFLSHFASCPDAAGHRT